MKNQRHFPSMVTMNGYGIFTIFDEVDSKELVIFCHGYRSSSIGPKRYFVDVCQELSKQGICSLRFDQYGSGNSDGDFIDSSFNDWVNTTTALVEKYQADGYRVSLFGQSMGASTALVAASRLSDLGCVVTWVPDPSVEPFTPPASGLIEENGQIVRALYWQEAHDADIVGCCAKITAPTLVIQCSDDEYVSAENHEALINNAQANHKLIMLNGFRHSSWTHEQGKQVIDLSVKFIVNSV